jgi:hypothetical protein
MTWPRPTPEEQVQFLRNMQRLLGEGSFVASYKYALLHALADLAVLKGEDTGAPLDLDTKDIAAKFVQLYWRQCRPFHVGGQNSGIVLQQNRKGQATIVAAIEKAQAVSGSSLFQLRLRTSKGWSKLVSAVNRVVCDKPLWRLQTVGQEQMTFLYDNVGGLADTRITLKPGVAFCLRAFYGLLRDLIQGAWVRFVQKLNAEKLGNLTDLGTFLFGQERASLEAYRPILTDVQKGLCLYCGKALSNQAQVDHFIPWSRYPIDLGQNFVLAHRGCNAYKSDYLADEKHLEVWAERNRTHQRELQERLVAAALPCDLSSTVQIAQWAYEQTEKAKGQVWVMEKMLQHLGASWRQCLVA